jgi:hypothetical protein
MDTLMTGFEPGRGGFREMEHVLMTGSEPGRGVLPVIRVTENNCVTQVPERWVMS